MRRFLLSILILMAVANTVSARCNVTAKDSLSDSLAVDSTGAVLSPRHADSSEDDTSSPLDKIIPKTPQAAALARYGEIPVSYATGVPEISIPLYNIQMGNYTLPISISYHASGIKADDVATSVGLGWVLNAGGAITRTVRGLPDLKYEDFSRDTLYRSYERCREITDINDISKIGNILAVDGEHPQAYDTESDRYTFNFSNKSGVFVYSLGQKAFVPLNYQPFRLEGFGGEDSHFRIVDTDGIEYYFCQQERTGCLYDEGQTDISAWYLTKVHTPNGDISLKYKNFGTFFTYSRPSKVRIEPELTWDDKGKVVDSHLFVHSSVQANTSTFIYDQVFLTEIDWNGNSVVFDYNNDRQDIGKTRLTRMTVHNSVGQTVKTAIFNNDCYAGNEITRDGEKYTSKRMLLKSVSISDGGTYSFSYNLRVECPYYYNEHGHTLPNYRKDYWGYLNGKAGATIPYELVKTAFDSFDGYDLHHRHFTYSKTERRMNPSAEYATMLILDGITYPSGGSTTFSYELNTPINKFGGLRIKEIRNGNEARNFSYKDCGTFDSVENFMWRQGKIFYWGNFLGYGDYDLIECEENPSFPCSNNNTHDPFYPEVRETFGNGDYIIYEYDNGLDCDMSGLALPPSCKNGQTSPLMNDAALNDDGYVVPNLLSKTYYGNDGKCLRQEGYAYSSPQIRKVITGTRVCTPYENMTEILHYYALGGFRIIPVMLCINCKETFGWMKHFRLMSKTVTDYTTNVTTRTDYTYDDSLRTLLPKSSSQANSDGKVYKTVYEYGFNSSDRQEQSLFRDLLLCDKLISTQTYCNGRRLKGKKYKYTVTGDFAYPSMELSRLLDNGWHVDVEYTIEVPISDPIQAVPF